VLGPEQINFVSRPAPVFLEGASAIRITEQVARAIGLQDHQIIRGLIQDRGGVLKLVLNNRDFDWQASKKFKPGDKIDFRVESYSQGRLLQPLALGSEKPVSLESGLGSSALSQPSRFLSLLYRPEQSSVLSQLFSPTRLDGLLSQGLSGPAGLRIGQLLFSINNISPDMIRSALVNSGLFGEFFLNNNLSSRVDIKQVLRGLVRSSGLQKTESMSLDKAIDEIESRQLEGLQAQQNREISYHFVIPFYDSDPVEIHFERGPGDFSQGETDWVINFHTVSSVVGQMWGKSTIKATSDIEMIIWAERQGAALMAEQGESHLNANLKNFGLNLSKFTVLNATRPLIDPSLTGPGQVVDVTT
jgi:hypothetical protein